MKKREDSVTSVNSNEVLQIGLSIPDSLSFRRALEGLIGFLGEAVRYRGKSYRFNVRGIKRKPYSLLSHQSCPDVILNRHVNRDPHMLAQMLMCENQSHLTSSPESFGTMDSCSATGILAPLGLFRFAGTWALPRPADPPGMNPSFSGRDMIYSDPGYYDITVIGQELHYPVYLFPHDGKEMVPVARADDYYQLLEAYEEFSDRPVILQEGVICSEYIRSFCVGPQTLAVHYDPSARFFHERYLRNGADEAVTFGFIPEQADRISRRLALISAAFFGCDHNSADLILSPDGQLTAVDPLSCDPDVSLMHLHFHFPWMVKALTRWLVFVAATGYRREISPSMLRRKMIDGAMKLKAAGSDSEEIGQHLENLAMESFGVKAFNDFWNESLPEFDVLAYQYFASENYQEIMAEAVYGYFKIPHERPEMMAHYEGIHDFWLHCERERLGL
ncbi:MAG: hypothetical protein CVV64_05410 [Candidatus Wallbacteria bacterium HGW-Wallbacteria-1]|jgi:hypothetical protein|uniref:ATP-grasp domain-containing protein n=1 Tax=Candidatus Wallbacteria bacterium HGW-Wallbacteria-1 TaxID=2013854 RepID=A0A2N1PS87_9BACT|nr:MAG: hypothetical protein CVV64_05410 [Candidatus Wallbacteria bacterium HGW-Wallbacteria-1]